MFQSKPKSWFIKFAILSVVIVLVLWLYNVVEFGSVKQQSYSIKERLTCVVHPYPNSEVKLPPEGLSNNQQQQQPLQKESKTTSDEEFTKRRRRINYVCSTGQVSGNVSFVMTDKQAGVIYCIVPKAGCTFWKRIFTAINSKSNDTAETISSMSREEVHSPYNRGVELYNTNFTNTKYPTRLVVTRDPYSRLISSYLDKLYLPDFWKYLGVRMTKKVHQHSLSNRSQDFLRTHFTEIAKLFENKSNKSECGKYITFSEFVDSSFESHDEHWVPIHKICNPCKFQPTHISRMETFSADARVLLSHMKLENIMERLDGPAQTDEEIKIISSYNFHHFYRNKALTFYKPCLSPKEIAYRLWYNFRWRGYIDPDVDYKLPELTDLKDIEEDFMVQVRAARKSGLQNPNKMRAAKNEFMKKAFLSLSKAMFEKISQKYVMDFELFGYTDIRDELYTYYTS